MDDRWQLTPMMRIEVIVGGDDVTLVTDLFQSVGASGFTALAGVSGLGHSGFHEGRLLFNDRSGLTLLIVVLASPHVDALLEGLRALFTQRPGVFMVAETHVSRPEYFA